MDVHIGGLSGVVGPREPGNECRDRHAGEGDGERGAARAGACL